jgi:hypothetical protein
MMELRFSMWNVLLDTSGGVCLDIERFYTLWDYKPIGRERLPTVYYLTGIICTH